MSYRRRSTSAYAASAGRRSDDEADYDDYYYLDGEVSRRLVKDNFNDYATDSSNHHRDYEDDRKPPAASVNVPSRPRASSRSPSVSSGRSRGSRGSSRGDGVAGSPSIVSPFSTAVKLAAAGTDDPDNEDEEDEYVDVVGGIELTKSDDSSESEVSIDIECDNNDESKSNSNGMDDENSTAEEDDNDGPIVNPCLRLQETLTCPDDSCKTDQGNHCSKKQLERKHDRDHGDSVTTKKYAVNLKQQRPLVHKNTISSEGNEFVSTAKGEEQWRRRYEELRAFKEEHGNCLVPQKYAANPSLGQWVMRQRQYGRKFENGEHANINERRMKLLKELGLFFEPMRVGNRGRHKGNRGRH